MIRLSTPALLQFYKEWLEHAESEHAHEFFYNSVGLCRNLENWVEHRSKCILDKYDGYDAIDQMKLQFEDAGRGYVYPFGEHEYDLAMMLDIQHKDENRLIWVKERIADVEGKQ